MGNSIQFIEQGVRLIASKSNWIEGDAIQQLKQVARLEGMQQVVGLPDLHPGRGYPIGAACFSESLLYPALVGNDIGCGMSLYQTSVDARKVKQDKWEKALRQKAFNEQERWSELGTERLKDRLNARCSSSSIDTSWLDEFRHSLGTIGGGNHFAEFQRIKRLYRPEMFNQQGWSEKAVFLLVHSGSRGVGERILREHVQSHGHKGLLGDSPEGKEYLLRHNQALGWAEVNRALIAERLSQALGLSASLVLDVNHNLVSAETIGLQTNNEQTNEEQSGWLHRKGVTPADQGWVVIPGSRGSASYLVDPRPSDVSLQSLAHGAGRKWIRTECEGRLRKKYRVSDLQRTASGSRVICDDRALMYQEAPEAYKSIDIVVSDLQEAGLLDIIAELEPVMTYKVASDRQRSGTNKADKNPRCC